MNWRILLVLMIITMIFGNVIGDAQTDYHEIKARADLKKYNGKNVKITGQISNAVMQHPVDQGPSGFVEKSYQQYLDTPFGQIVLVSKKEIDCHDKIEVTGRLKIVSLGGKKGTKTSYRNPFIEVDNFQCK